jgi:hypothetical protein
VHDLGRAIPGWGTPSSRVDLVAPIPSTACHHQDIITTVRMRPRRSPPPFGFLPPQQHQQQPPSFGFQPQHCAPLCPPLHAAATTIGAAAAAAMGPLPLTTTTAASTAATTVSTSVPISAESTDSATTTTTTTTATTIDRCNGYVTILRSTNAPLCGWLCHSGGLGHGTNCANLMPRMAPRVLLL